MKKLISLIFLTITLIFIGCGGVDSESSGNSTTSLSKVTKNTTVSYDKLGRITNENDVSYIYDENGNIVSIEKDNQ